MFTKKSWMIGIALSVALLLAVAFSPWLGRSAAQVPPVERTALVVPYSASLLDEQSAAVTEGFYDFRFALYDAEMNGTLLWSEAQEQVEVKDGNFTVLLGSVVALPQQILALQGIWLEVAVRESGQADFTILSPRQRFNPPFATEVVNSPTQSNSLSCEHTHFGESWSGAGLSGLVIHTPSGNFGGAFYGKTGGLGYGVVGEQAVTLSVAGGGIAGFSNSGSGYAGYFDNTGGGIGVFAKSNTNYGVLGRSTHGFGLVAEGNDSSYYDTVGDLLLGGTRGEIFSSGGMNIFSNASIFLDLDDDNNTPNVCFEIYNGENNLVGQTCENGTKSAVLQTKDYGQRAVYVIESPEVWLQDFGTATLQDGQATVTFEPTFAQTINPQLDYHVQLTPVCQEAVLLFVVSKVETGFTVKGVGLDGKSSSCSFDYTITVKRLGLEELRLEAVSSKR